MKKISMAAVAMGCLVAGVWAQGMPEYESTGEVQLVVDGKRAAYHTTVNTVPNQPGRRVDTARWKIFAPMMMGGINMAPPGRQVSLSARPAVEPDSSLPELKITFALDENTHTLLDSVPFEVSYIVKEGPKAGQYQHASGVLQILSVVPESEEILKITGRAAGEFAPQKKDQQGAAAGLTYEADFSVYAHRY